RRARRLAEHRLARVERRQGLAAARARAAGAARPGEPVSVACERWSRVKALLQEALERPPGERADFLAAAAGADTREEVEALLRAHEASPSYLERSAGELAGIGSGVDGDAAED